MANPVFYMTPGSCSTGIHILLEELELIFEARVVNLLAGDQNRDEYRALNPKGTIPVLVLKDGSVLTDFLSISWWLAKSYPKKRLLPEGLLEEMRVLEVMNYVVSTIHGQGYTRIFTTEKYSSDEADHEAIKAEGERIVKEGFELIGKWFPGSDYLFDHFSVADAALFYVEFWAVRTGIALPERCQSHYEAVLARRAVRQVLAEEGYSSALK